MLLRKNRRDIAIFALKACFSAGLSTIAGTGTGIGAGAGSGAGAGAGASLFGGAIGTFIGYFSAETTIFLAFIPTLF